MKITKRDLLRVIREEATKSTKKYDDAKELKGDQDELPDALQKGIIDKAKKEKKNERGGGGVAVADHGQLDE